MAPTELLAEQHARTFTALLAPLGMSPLLITGTLPARDRKAAAARLASTEPLVVVGTHALAQEGTKFARLGLAVVDEQHRFGVEQRLALGKKGARPDVLLMSATPIPRSLALTLYGDLDVSVLDERPPGRQPVTTVRRSEKGRAKVFDFIDAQVGKGRQAYIVFPLIEESDKIALRAATKEYEALRTGRFADRRVALLHGRLDAEEKDDTMRRFRDGEIDILISTTVIEVGIDVANATVMLIEHPERFGLSQLHQLRGRVGRGAEESFCILLGDVSPEVAERLEIFTGTDDGFKIARGRPRTPRHGRPVRRAPERGTDVSCRRSDSRSRAERSRARRRGAAARRRPRSHEQGEQAAARRAAEAIRPRAGAVQSRLTVSTFPACNPSRRFRA